MCLAMVNPYCTLCQVDFCSFAVFMSESSALLSLFIAMRLWRCGYFLLYISSFFFLLTKMKVNIRPGGQAGMRSASALERSALGIRFEIETLWRATSKQPLLLQLTTSGALLSGWVWGSFFLFSALLFTSFFSTQHTHTHSHTQNKRNRNHLFKIRFLVTSFINFRFFVYLFEAENFCSPRLRTLASSA